MNYNQFKNLSCYEEFEIQSALTGISKIDVLKEIGHKIDDYYFFISEDGIFNWFDLNGKHIEYPGVLKKLKAEYISRNITKCIIPDNTITIGDYTFAYCISIKEITIPDNVINIGNCVFNNCKSLTSITISNNITTIGDYTFVYCISIKEITIPDSVTSIGKYAFYDCKSLKEVIFKGKTLEQVKQLENYPFGIEDENIFKNSK